jgi:hypothetical protein
MAMKIWRVDWLPVLAIAVGTAVGVTVLDSVEDFVEGEFDDDDREVVIEASASGAEATWSPDGRWVAFRSNRESSIHPQPSDPVVWVAPKVTLTKTDGPARVIRVRGTKSVDSDPEPLIYIDGIRVESGAGIDDIEPSSVDRIEIVKNGAAVELYGKEAAGGVIQIFLKKETETGGN